MNRSSGAIPMIPLDDNISVCYVISAISTERAGTEGHLLRLVRALKRANHDPSLVVLQRSKWTDDFIDPDIPLHVLDTRACWHPKNWLSLAKLVRLFRIAKPKIVELYSPDAHFVGAIAAKLARVPVVVSCRRDLGYHYGLKERLKCSLGNFFTSYFLANADAVVRVISRLEKIDERRFHRIHNGIDLKQFDRELRSEPSREFLKSARGKRVVILSANLRPIKNVRGFLKVARQLASKYDNLLFVVLGGGDEEAELKALAAELGLTKKMFWAGSVPVTAAYLSRSDIACLTSDSEGFSNSIIEYMAARLPVVATSVGGVGEAVVDGETGWLVTPGDFCTFAKRVSQLLDNCQLRTNMGSAGRRRVEQLFTLDTHLAAHCEFYRKISSHRN
jgi:glycosyltransferase involved in cell wall biosynthesis